MVVVCLDKVSVLKIDIDCVVDREWLDDWERLVVNPVCAAFSVSVKSMVVSPSFHKGFHAYVHFAPAVDPELANRLQFLLGDDRHRVSLNRARIWAGLNEWNKLLEEDTARAH